MALAFVKIDLRSAPRTLVFQLTDRDISCHGQLVPITDFGIVERNKLRVSSVVIKLVPTRACGSVCRYAYN